MHAKVREAVEAMLTTTTLVTTVTTMASTTLVGISISLNDGSGENHTNRENNKEERKQGNPRDGDNNNHGNRCSYKEFLACQPKEFSSKGGMIAYTRWVEKIESMFDMSNYAINQRVKTSDVGMAWDDFKTLLRDEYCPYNEMQSLENKFWNDAMVGAGHTAYTNQFHELAKLIRHLSAILKAGGLTADAVMNGLLKRSSEKRKEGGEIGKQEDARSNNNRAKTGKGFIPSGVMLVNAINSANNPRVCYECGSPDHFHNACPKQSRTSGQVPNNPNQEMTISGNNFNRENNGNQARGRAFALGANEALQNLNIMTYNTLCSVQDTYAITLFLCISAYPRPCLDASQYTTKSSGSSRSVKIKALHRASFKEEKVYTKFSKCEFLLEEVRFLRHVVNKEGIHVDPSKIEAVKNWKAPSTPLEIQIPIKEDGILRVHMERIWKVAKALMNVKEEEPRISDIPVVRDFTDVFPKDLSGLPPQ
nr:reverse transcriptase domain-containing protein [Tanacetum cinerariifolium]